mmetsp:Transcript_77573/g.251139  ORF Transcript_77573/g.251139 Transcript_77573/m.251139 type:complete len:220 (-) Transcript_77573:5301-5960(-)
MPPPSPPGPLMPRPKQRPSLATREPAIPARLNDCPRLLAICPCRGFWRSCSERDATLQLLPLPQHLLPEIRNHFPTWATHDRHRLRPDPSRFRRGLHRLLEANLRHLISPEAGAKQCEQRRFPTHPSEIQWFRPSPAPRAHVHQGRKGRGRSNTLQLTPTECHEAAGRPLTMPGVLLHKNPLPRSACRCSSLRNLWRSSKPMRGILGKLPSRQSCVLWP